MVFLSQTPESEDVHLAEFGRFVLGAAIGGALGYAIVLMFSPGRRREQGFRTIYRARETSEERTAA
jgi:hypothetical protein